MKIETAGHCGYSVKYSPFRPGLLACATGTNFGLQGPGALFVIQNCAPAPAPQNTTKPAFSTTKDALFDVCWSELLDNQLITASGDGSLCLWEWNPASGQSTVRLHWQAHQREIFSVDWNPIDKQLILSASWDQSIKLWDPHRQSKIGTTGTPLMTWPAAHGECVYAATWSPHDACQFASAGGDCLVKLWSTRQQREPLLTWPAHSAPVLSIDYCKYPGQWAAQSILATAAVDGSIRVWDLRQPLYPLQQLNGHRMGVKRLRWSPFQGSLLASCGYDMTVRLWDAKLGKCLSVLDDHREFVYGLDWSLFEGGQLASCSWDRTIQIVNTIMGSG